MALQEKNTLKMQFEGLGDHSEQQLKLLAVLISYSKKRKIKEEVPLVLFSERRRITLLKLVWVYITR
jgi:hypothetical protein